MKRLKIIIFLLLLANSVLLAQQEIPEDINTTDDRWLMGGTHKKYYSLKNDSLSNYFEDIYVKNRVFTSIEDTLKDSVLLLTDDTTMLITLERSRTDISPRETDSSYLDVYHIPDESLVYTSLEDALKLPERVFNLNLKDQELTSLPDELEKLVNLETLDISINKFKEFPPVVFKLKSLKQLFAAGAQSYIDKADERSEYLLNSIPPAIGNLKNLEVLDLSYNMISTLPKEFSQLTKLKQLNLWHNDIKDTVVNRLCGLTQLEVLDIGGNDITRLPSAFANLQQLQSLSLHNSFAEGAPEGTHLGTFPKVICLLSELRSLGLSGQGIDEIPPEIGRLTKLKKLNLYANLFTEVPEELAKLTALEELNIGLLCLGPMNRLCDIEFTLPKDICNLKNLKIFRLYRKVTPAEKERIQMCFKFGDGDEVSHYDTKLYLGEQEIDTIPDYIYRLTDLEELNLLANKIGFIDSRISEMQNLKVLNLNINQLNTFPLELTTLTNLKELHIEGNNIKTIPPEISRMVGLEILSIGSTSMGDNPVDSLPPEIGDLINLKGLYVSNCGLKYLPPEIGKLSKLKTLLLLRNDLDSLPMSINRLKNLETLVMNISEMEQAPYIGGLTSLKDLRMPKFKDNSLPGGIENLVLLEEVMISHNSARTFFKVAHNFPLLKQVRIDGIENISDSRLKKIKKKYPNIKIEG